MHVVFLNLFLKELSIKYKGYIVVPVPSYIADDERRGFNHVEEVFSLLNLEMRKALIKTSHFKQAEKGAKKRQQIRKHLALKENVSLENHDVLIVDDIYTTEAKDKMKLEVCRVVENAIESYARDFKSEGISQEDLEDVLDKVKSKVDEISDAKEELKEEKDELVKNRIPKAENEIKRVFNKSDNNENNEE